ncbi:MAG TPA: carbon monoxide dehydrogenase, partial [Rhodospirillaceae bacterium]|nr:carbon monoxide dehydrogenase [Rhodospirillaceae bacterium]
MTENGIGASVRRKEDVRFLTGKGNYTDDVNVVGQSHAYFVRSPHAHATINNIDTSVASASDGVIAVLTGDDLAADGIGPLICGVNVTSDDGEPHKAPAHPALAQGKVNYVGDHVAVVIAETLDQAKDAAEKVEIDYGVLAAVTDTASAADNSQQQIHEEAPNNICYNWPFGDKDAVDDAFDSAHKITSLELVNNRMVTNPMEPRAAVGDYNSGTEEITLHLTTQNPHVHRLVLSAFNQLAPEHKLR